MKVYLWSSVPGCPDVILKLSGDTMQGLSVLQGQGDFVIVHLCRATGTRGAMSAGVARKDSFLLSNRRIVGLQSWPACVLREQTSARSPRGSYWDSVASLPTTLFKGACCALLSGSGSHLRVWWAPKLLKNFFFFFLQMSSSFLERCFFGFWKCDSFL